MNNIVNLDEYRKSKQVKNSPHNEKVLNDYGIINSNDMEIAYRIERLKTSLGKINRFMSELKEGKKP